MKILSEVLTWFGKNTYILGVCSISTLLGFLMTVYVSLKTKKIQNVLKEYKRIEKFNREGLRYKKQFKAYLTSLTEDNVQFRKVRVDILVDLRVVENKFKDILNRKEKERIDEAIAKIENGNQDDIDTIANELTKIIAIFSEEKES